ncbi:MAG: tol-pal system YbgF family protein [Pyrinomonadaceae bacterium]
MLKTFIFAAICFLSLPVHAQNVQSGMDLTNYGVRIEPDKRVMIVLATLEAARTTNVSGESVPVINTPLSAEGSKFRDLLKSDLAALPSDLRQKISSFLIAHKKRYPKLTDAELVAPFISMAYALTPPPELADPVVTIDLPGSLLDVLDFAPLVREFYRRSSFSGNLNEYVKTYQKAADGQLRPSAREMVGEILSYLNTRPQTVIIERVKTETQKSGSKKDKISNVAIRERERSFTIVPEMLAPRGTVNFVNVKDEYSVIVPAELEGRKLSSSEVRRGFLQFVVDPLIYSHSQDIETIRPLVKTLLDERRKADPSASPDVYLTISRSLAAAIDAKQDEYARVTALTAQARERVDAVKTDQEKRAIVQELERTKASLADETALRLSEDYEKGALLAFYFAEQLKGFGGSGFDIASSVKDMLVAFDGTRETDRLGQFAEARKRAEAARGERKKNPAATNIIVENPVTNRLVEIQKLIEAKNYSQASSELKDLLQKNPTEPRIHYSIGRVASLSAENITDPAKQKAALIEAKKAYDNVLKTAGPNTDRALLSLTFVALAKIYEFYDENAYAASIYDRAIQLGPVAGGAYAEARTAKARLVKEQ